MQDRGGLRSAIGRSEGEGGDLEGGGEGSEGEGRGGDSDEEGDGGWEGAG